jgi:hypothetical protein
MGQDAGVITKVDTGNDELIEIFNGNTEQEGEQDGVTDEGSSAKDEGGKDSETKEEDETKGTEESSEEGKETGQEGEETEEEEGTKEDEDDAAGETDKTEVDKDDDITSEIAALRATLREQKQELALLRARSVKTEEDEDGNRIPTNIEKLADSLKETFEANEKIYSLQADVLRGSSEYSDLDSVCSEENWDDIVDTVAGQAAKDQGISSAEAKLQVENFIWNQENPYKFMYETIKEYHPSFQEQSGKSVKDTGQKKSIKKKQEEHKAPGSVAKINASTTGKSGWTAEKIDNLPESELHKVPPDVYDKYMKDELD